MAFAGAGASKPKSRLKSAMDRTKVALESLIDTDARPRNVGCSVTVSVNVPTVSTSPGMDLGRRRELAVDLEAVRRLQVLDRPDAAALGQERVLARDGEVVEDDPVLARAADRHVVPRQQVPAGLAFDLVDELHQRHERAAIIGASRQSGGGSRSASQRELDADHLPDGDRPARRRARGGRSTSARRPSPPPSSRTGAPVTTSIRPIVPFASTTTRSDDVAAQLQRLRGLGVLRVDARDEDGQLGALRERGERRRRRRARRRRGRGREPRRGDLAGRRRRGARRRPRLAVRDAESLDLGRDALARRRRPARARPRTAGAGSSGPARTRASFPRDARRRSRGRRGPRPRRRRPRACPSARRRSRAREGSGTARRRDPAGPRRP